jgi:hypothetical protein
MGKKGALASLHFTPEREPEPWPDEDISESCDPLSPECEPEPRLDG